MPRRLSFALLMVVLLLLGTAGSAAPYSGDTPLDLEPPPGSPLAYPAPLPVFDLYWQSSWNQDAQNLASTSAIDADVKQVVGSSYGDSLGQYGVPHFSFGGTEISTCGDAPKSVVQSVWQSDVGDFLRCEVASGAVPGPTSPLYTAEMIYNVILPHGVDAKLSLPSGNKTSCVDFSAYHYYATYVAKPSTTPKRPVGFTLIYNVIPSTCATDVQHLTAAISHELVEAATDPVPVPPTYWIDESSAGDGSRYNPLAWGTLLEKGEAADICSTALYKGDATAPSYASRVEQQFMTAPFAGTLVGAYWSNSQNGCVVGPSLVVWTEFSSLGPDGPSTVSVNGVDHPLPYAVLLHPDDAYSFSGASLASGRRYRSYGDCSGTIGIPANTKLALAYRPIACGFKIEDQVTFAASGLSGQAWQVWFNGIQHDGPTSTWVDDGTSFSFAYGDVSGCTFTGATPSSPVFVSGGPATVTGNYKCAPPPPPPPVTYADVIRGDGPVAYWRLGDSGPTAHDSGPSGLDGSYEPGVSEGVPGAVMNDPDTAAEFAGGGVAVPSYSGLDILGPLSVEVWAKGGAQQPYAYLVSKSDWSGTFGYSLYAGPNGTLRFFVGTGSSQITDETGFTWNGQWHHIVGVYDGSAVSLYVDKVLVSSTPASGTIASSFGTPLTLGRFNGGGFTFAGDLDEVAIYNHALSLDEIHHHYNQGVFGSING